MSNMSNKIEFDYLSLLEDILENGTRKQTRNGEVLSVFGRTLSHSFDDGDFPLITTRKMPFKTMLTELLWFIRGGNNIKYLVDNNCLIWVGDAYANYLRKVIHEKNIRKHVKSYFIDTDDTPNIAFWSKEEFIDLIRDDPEFAEKWGKTGEIYGAQWRNWNGENIDQLQNLINELKTNPDSRRLLVNAWNPSVLDDVLLPPCHFSFQCYTRELSWDERLKLLDTTEGPWDGMAAISIAMDTQNIPKRAISLIFNMRSTDLPLGWVTNCPSYSTLLMIIAKMVNMVPERIVSHLGDCHIYANQIDGVKEQLKREPRQFPKIKFSDKINFGGTIDDFIKSCDISDIKLEHYNPHEKIHYPLSN